MFSALSQGSTIFILEKTPKLNYKTGEVIGVSQPRFGFNNQTSVDLKVKIDDSIQEFNSIPSINSLVTYNNGKVVISETKQGIQNEVEGILQTSRNILDNVDTYKDNVQECENILKQINPQFARDKERDDKLENLETKFKGFESKLDELLNLIKQ